MNNIMNKRIFMLALSALVLAGCSSDKVDVTGEESTSGFDANGNGYLSLSINLPTRSSSVSRASNSANDQYDDGIASEYMVKDAALLLFGATTGSTEKDVTLDQAIDLNFNMNDDADNDNITTQGNVTARISKSNKAYKYALVVLNRNDVFTISNGTLTFKDESSAFTGTFKEFSQKYAAKGAFDKNGIFMTNAVLASESGKGTSAPSTAATTLVNITKNIYTTAAEAEKNPAVDVIVERALAKVDVKNSMTSSSTLSLDGTEDNVLYPNNFAWELHNQNNTSYIVRNWDQEPVSADNKDLSTYGSKGWYSLKSDGDGSKSNPQALTDNPYRFVGTKEIKASGESKKGTDPNNTYYRTYFGVDPNYNAAPKHGDTETKGLSSESGFSHSSEEAVYCMENTFDVSNQKVMNTTCAVIKVAFKQKDATKAETFYTLNGTTSTIYTNGTSDADTKSLNAFVLNYVLTHYQKELITLGSTEFSKVTSVTGSGCSVSLDKDEAGARTISSVTLTISDGSTPANTKEVTISSTTLKDGSNSDYVLTELNDLLNIDEYKNGEAYYTVLIKHFGDDLTPWNSDQRTTDEAYPASTTEGQTANDRWLGRYGVLRNNWYEVEVSGVKRLGSSTVPNVEEDETTDDKIEQYLNVRVHVLSWAKRTQQIELE